MLIVTQPFTFEPVCLTDAFADELRALERRARQDNDKSFAAEARRQIGRAAENMARRLRDLAQNLVSRQVTVSVVVTFVDHQHGELGLVSRRAPPLGRNVFVEMLSVACARERVDVVQALELDIRLDQPLLAVP
jgi:hypothetical protein